LVDSRSQFTLFVPRRAATHLEAIRQVVDPIQAALIEAHVTLCREDEIETLSPALVLTRLASPAVRPLTLRFGRPQLFDGHGILLPCTAGDEEFHALRCLVLGSSTAKHHAPHITLAHPRNTRAAGNDLANAESLAQGLSITFTSVCRIRQVGSAPWQVAEEITLGTGMNDDA
jgi:hypothetical protein